MGVRKAGTRNPGLSDAEKGKEKKKPEREGG